MSSTPLAGVYAAIPTPFGPEGRLDREALGRLLERLAREGLHGVLASGTTGEGPSLSGSERLALFRATLEVARPLGLRVIAGTGCAALPETVELSRRALELGVDAVLVLPPFYFKDPSVDGLFDYFQALFRALPPEGPVLLYHIPQVTHMDLPLPLLERLAAAFPGRFAGLKDSSGDPEGTRARIEALPAQTVLVGADELLSRALAWGGGGAITAAANLAAPLLRAIWEAHRRGTARPDLQARLDRARRLLQAHPPFLAAVKALCGCPRVRPPLRPLPPAEAEALRAAWDREVGPLPAWTLLLEEVSDG